MKFFAIISTVLLAATSVLAAPTPNTVANDIQMLTDASAQLNTFVSGTNVVNVLFRAPVNSRTFRYEFRSNGLCRSLAHALASLAIPSALSLRISMLVNIITSPVAPFDVKSLSPGPTIRQRWCKYSRCSSYHGTIQYRPAQRQGSFHLSIVCPGSPSSIEHCMSVSRVVGLQAV